ncbi:uncharacterized protein LOC142319849 [Lycorma delicatula]|uniref:uncharacterized protein LOC142319849 n=1 Tax=Lycorma delicatula TaxID=130591 RepID=UPI003F51482E
MNEIFIKTEEIEVDEGTEDNLNVDYKNVLENSSNGDGELLDYQPHQSTEEVNKTKTICKKSRSAPSKQVTLTGTKSEEDDMVCQLIRIPFTRRSLFEKREILKKGRPTPSVQIGHTDIKAGKLFSRYFSGGLYTSFSWLTVSEARCKIYCWPCILFPVKKTMWNYDGYFDLKNLTRNASKHAKTKEHVMSCINLRRFMNQEFSEEEPKQLLFEKNDIVLNRELFKRLLDGLILSVRQNRRLDRTELYDCMLLHDTELKRLWAGLKEDGSKMDTLIKGLFYSVKQLFEKRILNEIHQASFFSIIVDEYSCRRYSVVVRYVDCKGVVCERFLSFFNVKEKNAEELFTAIDIALRSYIIYQCKLVAYSISGGCIGVEQITKFQMHMKSMIPELLYVNCSYHRLCEAVVAGAQISISETRAFFSALKIFPGFIINLLKKVPDENLEGHLNVDSDIKSTVNFIFEKREILIKFLEKLKDLDYISMSWSYFNVTLLKDLNFVYLLIIYKQIFSSFGDLELSMEFIGQMSYRNTVNDVKSVKKMLDNAVSCLKAMKSDKGLSIFFQSVACFALRPDDHLVELYNSLIDNALFHLNSRFNSLSSLSFLELVDARRFSSYSITFPKETFNTIVDIFGKFFDILRLKGELEVIYSDSAFRCGSPKGIRDVIRNSNLDDVLPEIVKLLDLIQTLPPTTGLIEPNAVTLSSVQRSINEYINADLPADVDVIYIQKDLLTQMEKSLHWYDDVMKIFAQSEFKHCLQIE